MAETMVRMGELAFSACAGDVLVSLGLGSCIGLALLDRSVAEGDEVSVDVRGRASGFRVVKPPFVRSSPTA